MATNDFKPFAAGADANVMTQADWVALAALVTGFQSGKASSAQVNKALRQGTVMASVLGQFVANNSGVNVLDNGDTATILANLTAALKSLLLTRAHPFADIKLDGAAAVAEALANLGSGDGTINGRLINVQTFTASGTYTPTLGTKSIIVEAIGGGGASANTPATGAGQNAISAAGANGAYAKARYTSPGVTTITIGSGGAVNGGSGGNGGRGGTTLFGALLSCPGGYGSGMGVAQTPPFNSSPAASSGNPSGSGILISSASPTTLWPLVIFNGMASNFVNHFVPLLSPYGRGGDGNAVTASQPSLAGAAGTGGCVLIWEYA